MLSNGGTCDVPGFETNILHSIASRSAGILCVNCQRRNLEGGISETSSAWIAVEEAPIKKWPGVKIYRSLGSSDNGHKGIEFSQSSICDNNVREFFKCK